MQVSVEYLNISDTPEIVTKALRASKCAEKLRGPSQGLRERCGMLAYGRQVSL